MYYNVFVLGTACVDHTVFAGDLTKIFDASRRVLDGKKMP
jgi:hypothetical protein